MQVVVLGDKPPVVDEGGSIPEPMLEKLFSPPEKQRSNVEGSVLGFINGGKSNSVYRSQLDVICL